MALNSCLYECSVMHRRRAPKLHALRHAIFMLYLDLDEIEQLGRELRVLSHNRFNLYTFRDDDHLPSAAPTGSSLKQRLAAHLHAQGVSLPADCRVMLLTLPRILGYVFNPIAIYFCFGARTSAPLCAVAEVGNTFGEHKLYVLGPGKLQDGAFRLRVPKHYYVSPFSALTLQFQFRLRPPGEALDIRVDDYDGAQRVLCASLAGQRRMLGDARLLWYALKYPLLTVKVIALIHWHAALLWLKGVPWHRKSADPTLQRDVLHPHASLTAPQEAPRVALHDR